MSLISQIPKHSGIYIYYVLWLSKKSKICSHPLLIFSVRSLKSTVSCSSLKQAAPCLYSSDTVMFLSAFKCNSDEIQDSNAWTMFCSSVCHKQIYGNVCGVLRGRTHTRRMVKDLGCMWGRSTSLQRMKQGISWKVCTTGRTTLRHLAWPCGSKVSLSSTKALYIYGVST